MLANAVLSFFNRRSIENPSTPLSDPDAWLLDLAGGMADSGVRVNRQTILTYAAVFRALRLISGVIGKVPLDVLKYLPTGGKERAKDHPAHRLLRRKPCAEMTAFVFRQTLQAHVLTHGNGYAYIFRDGKGRPTELWPLLPSETYPLRVNRHLWYVTSIHLGEDKVEQRKIDSSNVLHIKGLGYDGLVGYSVIDIARTSLGLGMAAAKYGSKFFANNAEPRVVIEHPGDWKKQSQEEFIRQWNAMHAGLDNSHKTAILTQGAKLNPFSLKAADAQLLETRKHEIREVANWFDLPPHKLGDDSRTAYNSLEMEEQSCLNDCYDPWMVCWEEECMDKLLTEEEKESEQFIVEFNRRALIRADAKTESQVLIGETNAGLITLDEARAIRNMPALPDGVGAKHRMPANLVLMSADPEWEPTTKDTKEGEEPAEPNKAPAEPTETTTPAPLESSGDAAKSGQVQGTALNGTQITGLLAIVADIISGEISAKAGKAILAASFPLMAQSEIDAIVDNLEVKEPEPAPQAPPGTLPAVPPVPAEPPAVDPAAGEGDRAGRRAVIFDAATRATKRITAEARRAATSPVKHSAWLKERQSVLPAIVEILSPAVLLASRGREDPVKEAKQALAWAHETLDRLGARDAKQMDSACTAMEISFPARIIDRLLLS